MPALELRAVDLTDHNPLPGINWDASPELKAADLTDHNLLPGINLDASPKVESCWSNWS